MNYLHDMRVEEMQTMDAIAHRCARQLLLPVVAELFPHNEELKTQIEWGGLPRSLPTTEAYWAGLLREGEARLAALEAMTTEEIEDSRRVDQAKLEEEIASINANLQEKQEACRAALRNARRWRPPSSKHKALKRLMISELKEEIDRCQKELDYEWIPRPEAPALHESFILGVKQSIECYRNRLTTKIPEVERWNRWLRELHEACPAPGTEQESPSERSCAETT